MQCEVLIQNLLGETPVDEDPIPPKDPKGHELSFNLFGLGQPVELAPLDLNILPNEEKDVAANEAMLLLIHQSGCLS